MCDFAIQMKTTILLVLVLLKNRGPGIDIIKQDNDLIG
jgi:hypothetical protein